MQTLENTKKTTLEKHSLGIPGILLFLGGSLPAGWLSLLRVGPRIGDFALTLLRMPYKFHRRASSRRGPRSLRIALVLVLELVLVLVLSCPITWVHKLVTSHSIAFSGRGDHPYLSPDQFSPQSDRSRG